MQTLWLDVETFYSSEYSLRRLNPARYALDPRYETIGLAAIVDNHSPIWIDGPDVDDFFAGIDWANTLAISHNALFDFAVFKWRYGVLPAKIGDTLGMARAWIYGKTGSVSLKKCAEFYGLPGKGDTLQRMNGIGFHGLKADQQLYREFVSYGLHDVELCKALYKIMLAEGFPLDQLDVIDMQCRMCVAPKFVFDPMLLAEHLVEVRAEKDALLQRTGLANKDALMSSDQFAVLLMDAGVLHPPVKTSKATGKESWAFSRQDRQFTDLLDSPNPDVQTLVGARLGHKSTLEETRTEAFLHLAHLDWQNEAKHTAPIPLKFSGAWTHRFSGDWSLNLQNLPRKGKLRNALRAPEGQRVVAVDASQLEARLTAALAGQVDLIEQFKQGEDVYSIFASRLFGHAVSKQSHPVERFIGKVAILSLQYGSGWMTFQGMVRAQSDRKTQLSDIEAQHAVDVYRQANFCIKNLWYRLDDFLPLMKGGETFEFGPFRFDGEVMILPNGMHLIYNDLESTVEPDQNGRLRPRWTYRHGNMPRVIYGAKLLENMIQSLAFIAIMDAALRIRKMTEGLLIPAHQVHDELIYVVPEDAAELVLKIVKAEMVKPLPWLRRAPLAAEGGIGTTYGNAKGD